MKIKLNLNHNNYKTLYKVKYLLYKQRKYCNIFVMLPTERYTINT